MLSSGPPTLPPATREECLQLAGALPDDPFTVNLRSALRNGNATVYLDGPPQRPRGAVVVYPWALSETRALGTHARAIVGLLRRIPGWFCVDVPTSLAASLATELQREFGAPTQVFGDLYFVLERPATPHRHPSVRLLGESDVPLVRAAPEELRQGWESTWLHRPREYVAAGGIIDGHLVGAMLAFASSEKFSELGGSTLEPLRHQGIGSAAAYLVSQEIRASGRTPVWSTGEDNYRSQRVAAKVGFREYGRLTYVLVPRFKEAGGFDPAHPFSPA